MNLFANAEVVTPDRDGIRITGPKKTDYLLERQNSLIIFESTELAARSTVSWPEDYENKQSQPKHETTITATLKPSGSILYAFGAGRFLGPIETFTLHCAEADQHHLMARVWEPNNETDFNNALHISCTLERSVFKEVFHPIWLRQSESKLHLNLRATSYQWGPGASFSNIGDISNIVLEAGKSLVAKISAISLITPLSPQLPEAQ
jgi:hypothetical protein